MPPAAEGKLTGSPGKPALSRQAILILGMHRSGTSALAGVVTSLGAAGPKTLLETNIYNPRGFWESAPLVRAHDDLLASAGSSWDDWRRFNSQWLHSNEAKRDHRKIEQILLEEFGAEPLFVIKDPRTCRFVPFISSVLKEMNVRSVALLPLRNPLEVAYSLKRRDGLSIPRGLLLWLRHVLDAERDTRGMPRCFLNFEDLLTGWRHQLDRAAKAVGIVWPSWSKASEASVEQFLTMDLYHEKNTLEDMRSHPDVARWVSETYDILRTIAAEGENEELLEELDLMREKFEESCNVFGALDVVQEQTARRLREELSLGAAEVERQRASVNQYQIKVMQREQDVAQLRADNQRMACDLRASAEELQALRDVLAEREANNNV
jgi:hypothetical protein